MVNKSWDLQTGLNPLFFGGKWNSNPINIDSNKGSSYSGAELEGPGSGRTGKVLG